jgi:hypothetical protein
MLKESQMLGLITSNQSPEKHLQGLSSRFVSWKDIARTAPDSPFT